MMLLADNLLVTLARRELRRHVCDDLALAGLIHRGLLSPDHDVTDAGRDVLRFELERFTTGWPGHGSLEDAVWGYWEFVRRNPQEARR